MMTVADDLRAARALIDTPEKWCKDRYQDDDGRLCASGALRKIGAEPFRHPSWDALFEQAKAVAQVASVSEFNDRPQTTHADILALFDRAIQAAEAS